MAEPNEKPVVAVFDFDGTITYVDSFLPFLRHIGGFFGFWFGMISLSPVLAMHAAGFIKNWQAKERFLTWFLKGRSPDDLAEPSKEFTKTRLQLLINPIAIEKVQWHRDRGHRLLLLSASPELYLQHWTADNGFEKVMGTRLSETDGKLNGKIEGENCHGEEKIHRLREELGNLSDYEIHSYGDSRSDKPLLNLIDHAEYRCFESRSKLGYKITGLLRFTRSLL